MAMTSMNISLTEDLKAFIDAQVAEGAYATSSEYVRDLVRRDRETGRVRAMLFEGRDSGPGELADEAYFERMHEHIRARPRRRA